MFDLSGQVAIVTGSTRGIGRAIAQTLAEAGAHVVISSEDAAACSATVEEFVALELSATAVVCDLSQRGAIRDLVQITVQRYQRLNILVCNAGIEGPLGPLAQAGEADIQRTLDINLHSSITLTSAAIPHMVQQGGGSVILIASIAGVRGNRSIGMYGISKAALAQLGRNLAVEWGPQGVRANCISPGLIATDFSRGVMDNTAFMERRLSLTPLRRVGQPQEIAAAALFLASKGGAFVTGQNLIVDGGTVISDGN